MVGDELLCDDTSDGKHCKTTVVDFFGLDFLELSVRLGLQAEGVKLDVTIDIGLLKTGKRTGRFSRSLPAVDDVVALHSKGKTDHIGGPCTEDTLSLLVLVDSRARDLTAEEEGESLASNNAYGKIA